MAFDDVAAIEELFVERRWSANGGAFVLLWAVLVGLLLDHCVDAPAGEVFTDAAVGIGHISDHFIWAGPGPS